jgi:hypothetical protein
MSPTTRTSEPSLVIRRATRGSAEDVSAGSHGREIRADHRGLCAVPADRDRRRCLVSAGQADRLGPRLRGRGVRREQGRATIAAGEHDEAVGGGGEPQHRAPQVDPASHHPSRGRVHHDQRARGDAARVGRGLVLYEQRDAPVREPGPRADRVLRAAALRDRVRPSERGRQGEPQRPDAAQRPQPVDLDRAVVDDPEVLAVRCAEAYLGGKVAEVQHVACL